MMTIFLLGLFVGAIAVFIWAAHSTAPFTENMWVIIVDTMGGEIISDYFRSEPTETEIATYLKARFDHQEIISKPRLVMIKPVETTPYPDVYLTY